MVFNEGAAKITFTRMKMDKITLLCALECETQHFYAHKSAFASHRLRASASLPEWHGWAFS